MVTRVYSNSCWNTCRKIWPSNPKGVGEGKTFTKTITKLFVRLKRNKNVLKVKIVNLTKTRERGTRGGRIDYFLLHLCTHRER